MPSYPDFTQTLAPDHDHLTVFTAITESYEFSAELSHSFELVRRALPAGTKWFVHTSDMTVSARDMILNNLPDQGDVLLIREPALLMVSGIHQTLRRILHGLDNPLVVLPGDIRGYPAKFNANYHTLRGFERFSEELSKLGNVTTLYDGRQPWMLLVRAETINLYGLGEDPFDLPPGVPVKRVVVADAAYIHPFLNYYRESRAELLPFVPEGIRSLLDIGCSSGGFGAAVKQARGCRVAGVEINRHEAEVAAGLLDKVWVGELFSLAITEQFDCVSCLDVLEHFADPHRLLKTIRLLLRPGGTLLLSVPNVGHWSVVEDLIAGRWDYIPAGILCSTHLRFFTRNSLIRLIEESDFRIMHVDAVRAPLPESSKRAFSGYCREGAQIDEENLSVVQYIIQAVSPF